MAQSTAPVWLVAVEQRDGIYQSALFVDLSRAINARDTRQAWVTVIQSPQHPAREYERIISLEEYDCPAGRARSLQITGYYPSGDTRTLAQSEWGYVVPGSFGDRMMRFLCGRPDAYNTNGLMMLPASVTMQEAADALFASPSRY